MACQSLSMNEKWFKKVCCIVAVAALCGTTLPGSESSTCSGSTQLGEVAPKMMIQAARPKGQKAKGKRRKNRKENTLQELKTLLAEQAESGMHGMHGDLDWDPEGEELQERESSEGEPSEGESSDGESSGGESSEDEESKSSEGEESKSSEGEESKSSEGEDVMEIMEIMEMMEIMGIMEIMEGEDVRGIMMLQAQVRNLDSEPSAEPQVVQPGAASLNGGANLNGGNSAPEVDVRFMVFRAIADKLGMDPGLLGRVIRAIASSTEQLPEFAWLSTGRMVRRNRMMADFRSQRVDTLNSSGGMPVQGVAPTAMARSFVTNAHMMNRILSFGTPDDLMAWQRVSREWYTRLVPEALTTVRPRVLHGRYESPMMSVVHRDHATLSMQRRLRIAPLMRPVVDSTWLTVVGAIQRMHEHNMVNPVCLQHLDQIIFHTRGVQAEVAKFLASETDIERTRSHQPVHGRLYQPETRDHDAGLHNRKYHGVQPLSSAAVTHDRELENDSEQSPATKTLATVQTILFVPAWLRPGAGQRPAVFLEVQCWNSSRTALLLRKYEYAVKYVVGDVKYVVGDVGKVSVKRFHQVSHEFVRNLDSQEFFLNFDSHLWKVYKVNSFHGNEGYHYTGEEYIIKSFQIPSGY